jgi:trans-aconitate methyltransferase
MAAETTDVWAAGDAYEPYVGRWSRPVARDFLGWLKIASKARWLDVGCGTGALTQAVIEKSRRVRVPARTRPQGCRGLSRTT